MTNFDISLTTPLPNEDLIYLVNGHRDVHAYDLSRHAVPYNIIELLKGCKIDIFSLRRILDFGCGCGRVLSGWEHILSHGKQELFGVDINASLVSFCVENIPFAQVDKNNLLPR